METERVWQAIVNGTTGHQSLEDWVSGGAEGIPGSEFLIQSIRIWRERQGTRACEPLQPQHEEAERGLQEHVTVALWAVWVEEVVRGWVSFPSLRYWNRKLVIWACLIVTHRHTASSGSPCTGIRVPSSSSDGSVLVPRQHYPLQSRRPALQSRQGWQLPRAGQRVHPFGLCPLRAVSTAFNLVLHTDTFVPACAGCYPLYPLQHRGKEPLYPPGQCSPQQSVVGFTWLTAG